MIVIIYNPLFQLQSGAYASKVERSRRIINEKVNRKNDDHLLNKVLVSKNEGSGKHPKIFFVSAGAMRLIVASRKVSPQAVMLKSAVVRTQVFALK